MVSMLAVRFALAWCIQSRPIVIDQTGYKLDDVGTEQAWFRVVLP